MAELNPNSRFQNTSSATSARKHHVLFSFFPFTMVCGLMIYGGYYYCCCTMSLTGSLLRCTTRSDYGVLRSLRTEAYLLYAVVRIPNVQVE